MGYQNAQSIQAYWAGSNATSNLAYYPTNITVYPSLPSVVSPQAEYAFDRDAKLTPLEWLKRQVDDVCALAVA